MKIVVLDGFTANPGDLSWTVFESLGECRVYERSAECEVLERASGAAVLLTNKVVLDEPIMSQLPALKYIGVLATGVNVVDLAAAAERGIVVTNIPAYGPASVAQMVFSHLLNFVQPVDYYARGVKQGRWAAAPDFCFYDHTFIELEGLTMGVVGYGAIAQRVGRLAQAFGMKLLVHSRRCPEVLPAGAEFVDLDDLFERSDVVSLHCPLTEHTKHLMDAQRLSQMKPSAYLINTARGPLIDESALYHALKSKALAGAALDVLAVEPPAAAHPLNELDNCNITPHIAWATQAARQRLLNIAEDNVRAFVNGTPINQVN